MVLGLFQNLSTENHDMNPNSLIRGWCEAVPALPNKHGSIIELQGSGNNADPKLKDAVTNYLCIHCLTPVCTVRQSVMKQTLSPDSL